MSFFGKDKEEKDMAKKNDSDLLEDTKPSIVEPQKQDADKPKKESKEPAPLEIGKPTHDVRAPDPSGRATNLPSSEEEEHMKFPFGKPEQK